MSINSINANRFLRRLLRFGEAPFHLSPKGRGQGMKVHNGFH